MIARIKCVQRIQIYCSHWCHFTHSLQKLILQFIHLGFRSSI